MERIDQRLNEEVAHAVRDAVRAEMKEGVRAQKRRAGLYAGAGAVALYAGAAAALALGLVLALGMPDWAAALVVAVVLGVAAFALRQAARPGTPDAPTAPPMPSAPPPPGI
ncbi:MULTISPECIES: phage holin family protein [Streptomyces]|uniref:phage holin family protein n=1 Tax=Streptomyces TaxID=1883 RepID=UPI00210EEFD8|nr:phage holin family protein [Streptomyces longispororuber]MCQ4208454.1 phage holin family protein [Streptomyces longispororuber]